MGQQTETVGLLLLFMFWFLILMLLSNFHFSKRENEICSKPKFKLLNYFICWVRDKCSWWWAMRIPQFSCFFNHITKGLSPRYNWCNCLKKKRKSWFLKQNSLGQVWGTLKHFLWGKLPRAREAGILPSLMAAQSDHWLQKSEVVPHSQA